MRVVAAAGSNGEHLVRPDTKIKADVTEAIGGTPMVFLTKVVDRCYGRIAAKLESLSPACSVKDRIGLHMVKDAEEKGLIRPGVHTLVEPTSGNTGVGLAMVCAAKGYRLILTMPENASIERRMLLQGYGAQVMLTKASLGMRGAVAKAEEIVARNDVCVSLGQFNNDANPRIHSLTTGPEIWADTAGKVDVLVAGVGTGGTLTGVSRFLKSKNPRLQVVAVEPAESPVLSGGRPGFHLIEGIGAGFVPKVLDMGLVDEIQRVTTQRALAMSRTLCAVEGLLCGISSGAAAAAAVDIAKRPEMEGKLIVVIIPSFGERYLSTPLFKDVWMEQQAVEEALPKTWQGFDNDPSSTCIG
eukprot:jgi/Mesvir1/8244/Mv12521-RA.1